jgi:hypothetical protein
MIPYIEDFLTQRDADDLKESVLSQPPVRERNARNGTLIRKIHYGTYSPVPESHYGKTSHCRSVESAPDYIKSLAKRLSAYAGKEINYLSQIGYESEKDHIGWHNHREDLVRKDQSVWVISLGQVRELALRPAGNKDKSTWEYLYPAHGSLYVLPSDFNKTHEHAILDQDFPCSLRISINCKHVEADYVEAQLAKLAGKKPEPAKKKLVVATNGMQSIYCCRKNCEYPPDAVYVGRKYGDRPNTPFGNHKRLTGDAWLAEVAEKMKSPEFRAQVEALRGKDLLCWCEPREAERCHARAWLELANGRTADAAAGTPRPEPPGPPKRKKARAPKGMVDEANDKAALLAWTATHWGTARACARLCPDLSCRKVKYVLALLEELAAIGPVKAWDVPRVNRMSQYTLAYGHADWGPCSKGGV